MSFFDDLKSEPKKEEFVIPTGYYFTCRQREKVVSDLVRDIKSGCLQAKRNNKRGFSGVPVWGFEYVDHDYSPSEYVPYASFIIRESWSKHLTKQYTQAERDEILRILRIALAREGFPADCVQPYNEEKYEIEGKFIFEHKVRYTLYKIKVNVKW